MFFYWKSRIAARKNCSRGDFQGGFGHGCYWTGQRDSGELWNFGAGVNQFSEFCCGGLFGHTGYFCFVWHWFLADFSLTLITGKRKKLTAFDGAKSMKNISLLFLRLKRAKAFEELGASKALQKQIDILYSTYPFDSE